MPLVLMTVTKISLVGKQVHQWRRPNPHSRTCWSRHRRLIKEASSLWCSDNERRAAHGRSVSNGGSQTQRLLPKVALLAKPNPREKRVLTRLELLSEGELVGIARDERRAKNSLRT
jgi:hypothetical protein